MEQTTYPFIDWTDFPQADGSRRSRVIEDIRLGTDHYRPGTLTRVPLFSSRFRPTRFSVAGRAVGLVAENDGGEYSFYALFDDVAVGELVRLTIHLEGPCTGAARGALTPDGYHSNFAWEGPHVQRIVFPKGYRIASASPDGGVVGRWHGYPLIIWRRAATFVGDVAVRFGP